MDKQLPLPTHRDEEALRMLEKQCAREISLTSYPLCEWVPSNKQSSTINGHNTTNSNGEPAHHPPQVYDVLIVGGGQSGLATAFALYRECVYNYLVIDENDCTKEGPWRAWGKMTTLLTGKDITGIDSGIPSLTIQAYVEAAYGVDYWNSVFRIPRLVWADYLDWFRTTTGVKVQNNTRMTSMKWLDDKSCFSVNVIVNNDKESTIFCKKLVLATGFEGAGEWSVPPSIQTT
jgi:cation diffusion facilitator CzcD-associated flavoprotein CzcO